MMYLSLRFYSFFLLMFFLLSFMFAVYCTMYNLVYFIEWEIIMLNSSSVVMTLLLDWV